MDRGEQMAHIADYAADQWGLITAAQAKRVGLSAVQILRLVESGLIENVGRGVYVLRTAVFPSHLELRVAWLRLMPTVFASERRVGDKDSGVISHASACQLHGLGDIPAPAAEISVPRRRTTTEPFVHLRTAKLEPADITLVEGLPVTTPRRTILDLLRSKADGGHLGGVIADAERRDLITLEELESDVRPFAHAYGLPRRSTGVELMEHLVSQGDQRLRSQEVALASQQGFATAVRLMAERVESDQRAVHQLVGRLIDPQTGPLLAYAKAAAPSAELTDSLKRALEQTAIETNFAAHLQNLQAPNPSLAAAIKRVYEQLTAPTANLEAALARIQAPSDQVTAALKLYQTQATDTRYEQALQRLLHTVSRAEGSRAVERPVLAPPPTEPQFTRGPEEDAEVPRATATEQRPSNQDDYPEDSPSRAPSHDAPEDP
ncbi:type IV toxin-antitoxin system AbiEi family antitoxin domain-containing protein [Streptomyces erythrochromogenes]|uniref:type IV toxin-antitoxin system AbiEi family antitoxin domain-containing protein n=1 Tax=Streptomyces erythrochromogenes TaxID=285574 RepID=UPI0036D092B7